MKLVARVFCFWTLLRGLSVKTIRYRNLVELISPLSRWLSKLLRVSLSSLLFCFVLVIFLIVFLGSFLMGIIEKSKRRQWRCGRGTGGEVN